jgi:hypothetical protein
MLIHMHEHRQGAKSCASRVLGLRSAEKLRVLKDWKHTFAGVSQLGIHKPGQQAD